MGNLNIFGEKFCEVNLLLESLHEAHNVKLIAVMQRLKPMLMKSDETVPETECQMQKLQSHKMEDDFSAAFQSHLGGDGLLVSFITSLSRGSLVRISLASCHVSLTQVPWHLSQHLSRSELAITW